MIKFMLVFGFLVFTSQRSNINLEGRSALHIKLQELAVSETLKCIYTCQLGLPQVLLKA